MHREPDLGALVAKASRRALMLREIVRIQQPPVSHAESRAVAYVTIEAFNLWSLFCRMYYLSTALRARDGSGSRVTLGVAPPKTEEEALTVAIHQENRSKRGQFGGWTHRDEPAWENVTVFGRVLSAIQPSNLATAQAGLGAMTRAPADLQTIRNFYAHRSELTASKARGVARRYALSSGLRPSDLLCTRLPGRPQGLLADWVDELVIVIRGMV